MLSQFLNGQDVSDEEAQTWGMDPTLLTARGLKEGGQLMTRAQLSLSNGRIEDAMLYCRKALELDPHNIDPGRNGHHFFDNFSLFFIQGQYLQYSRTKCSFRNHGLWDGLHDHHGWL